MINVHQDRIEAPAGRFGNEAPLRRRHPECDTVHCATDRVTTGREMLRTRVGIKEYPRDTLRCYCKLSRGDRAQTPSLRRFVLEKTCAGKCSCEISNPSGR